MAYGLVRLPVLLCCDSDGHRLLGRELNDRLAQHAIPRARFDTSDFRGCPGRLAPGCCAGAAPGDTRTAPQRGMGLGLARSAGSLRVPVQLPRGRFNPQNYLARYPLRAYLAFSDPDCYALDPFPALSMSVFP